MRKNLIIFFCFSITIGLSQNKHIIGDGYQAYNLNRYQIKKAHLGMEYAQKYIDSLNAYPNNKLNTLPSFFL